MFLKDITIAMLKDNPVDRLTETLNVIENNLDEAKNYKDLVEKFIFGYLPDDAQGDLWDRLVSIIDALGITSDVADYFKVHYNYVKGNIDSATYLDKAKTYIQSHNDISGFSVLHYIAVKKGLLTLDEIKQLLTNFDIPGIIRKSPDALILWKNIVSKIEELETQG